MCDYLTNSNMEQTLLLPTHRKLLIGFKMIYLHLTLAHSEAPDQDHACLDCKYLIKDNRLDKHYNCHQIESLLFGFDWHIYIWPWLILKMKGQDHLHFDYKNCENCIILHFAVCQRLHCLSYFKISNPSYPKYFLFECILICKTITL